MWDQSLREGITCEWPLLQTLGEGEGGAHTVSQAADPSQGPPRLLVLLDPQIWRVRDTHT